jgi:hypothetical protein
MEQIQFRPSDSSGKFDPVTQIDLIPAIDRRDRRLSQAEDQAFRQLQANNKTRQINAQRLGKDLEALAEFSKTLNDQLAKDLKARNKAEMQEGIMEAYYEGVSPEKQEQFKQDENALRETGAAANKLAEQVEEQTGDVFVADRFRSMSGWKKYGYALGMVQRGASNYAMYYENAKESAAIEVEGKGVVTFDNATEPEEYAALQEQVNQEFLNQFVGVNPALLNEHLFETMQTVQKRDAISWAQEQRQLRQAQLKGERYDEVVGLINNSDTTAEELSRFILDHPKGPRQGKLELAELIAKGIDDRIITGQDALRLLRDSQTTDSRGTGSLISKDKGIFGFLEAKAEDAIAGEIDRESREIDDQLQVVTNDILKTIDDGDGVITPQETKALIQYWRDNTNNAPLPENIKDRLYADDEVDLDEARIRLRQIEATRLYLIESDFKGLPKRLMNEFNVRSVEEMTPNEEQVRFAKKQIVAGLDTKFENTDGTKRETNSYRTMEEEAYYDYLRLYAEFINTEDPKDAHRLAYQRVVETIDPTAVFDNEQKIHQYLKRNPETTQNERDRVQLHRRMIKDDKASLRTTPYLSQAEMDLGLKYLKGQSVEPPQHAVNLARRIGIPTYDLLAMQAKAFKLEYKPERPKTEGEVDGLDPAVQELLRKYPSASRTLRAVTQTEGNTKWFLDSIASVESAAHGEYEAMNTGGTGIGVNNMAYGSANSCDVTGCLTGMTIGEVMNRQAKGEIFAAGRYQFIPTTLRDTVNYMGISLDTPYDATTQDALAIGRLHWRLSLPGNNNLLGLRTEWQGLHKRLDSEVQPVLDAGREVTSVYNRPENILPALRS